MVSLARELLIQSPIGRIKWPQAPNDYNEILENLTRTFKIGKSGVRLRDQFSTDVTAFNYNVWANTSDSLELFLTIDYSVPAEPEEVSELKEQKSYGISDLKNKAMTRLREIGEKSVSPDPPPQRGARGKKAAPRARVSEEEQKMLQGLDILMNSCGFTDEAQCREALKKSNYDPQQAINLLFT